VRRAFCLVRRWHERAIAGAPYLLWLADVGTERCHLSRSQSARQTSIVLLLKRPRAGLLVVLWWPTFGAQRLMRGSLNSQVSAEDGANLVGTHCMLNLLKLCFSAAR
jgi:hypothetical protein